MVLIDDLLFYAKNNLQIYSDFIPFTYFYKLINIAGEKNGKLI